MRSATHHVTQTDPHLDELNLDETLLTRAREAHQHDHIDEDDRRPSAWRVKRRDATNAITPIGFDPASTDVCARTDAARRRGRREGRADASA
jgi:hypothetical protein